MPQVNPVVAFAVFDNTPVGVDIRAAELVELVHNLAWFKGSEACIYTYAGPTLAEHLDPPGSTVILGKTVRPVPLERLPESNIWSGENPNLLFTHFLTNTEMDAARRASSFRPVLVTQYGIESAPLTMFIQEEAIPLEVGDMEVWPGYMGMLYTSMYKIALAQHADSAGLLDTLEAIPEPGVTHRSNLGAMPLCFA